MPARHRREKDQTGRTWGTHRKGGNPHVIPAVRPTAWRASLRVRTVAVALRALGLAAAALLRLGCRRWRRMRTIAMALRVLRPSTTALFCFHGDNVIHASLRINPEARSSRRPPAAHSTAHRRRAGCPGPPTWRGRSIRTRTSGCASANRAACSDGRCVPARVASRRRPQPPAGHRWRGAPDSAYGPSWLSSSSRLSDLPVRSSFS